MQNDKKILQFIEKYKTTYEARKAYINLIYRLSRKGKYTRLISIYKNIGSTDLECLYIRAKIKKNQIENIKKKINLTLDETEQLFDKIFNGEVNTSSLTSLLDALDKKGETPDELAGATTSMRKNSKSIDVNHNQVIDCCGTGGLGKKMINVSTSVSFVLAAAGLKVAKHGNRTATGKSGSADFLEAAGINLNESSKYFSDSLDKIGLGFLFAQNHHPGMKYVMEARRILGKKTIFNLLGPLSNPAGANIQSIGVFHGKWIKPVGEALRNLNCKAAAIFHSDAVSYTHLTLPTKRIV